MTEKTDKKRLGHWGEELAVKFLEQKKFRLIETNYSCRMGEIDVIAEDNEYIIFAEVKLRKNADFANAREFVTEPKQERIRTTAEVWLQEHPTELQPRFDVIEIYAPYGEKTQRMKIYHIENAF